MFSGNDYSRTTNVGHCDDSDIVATVGIEGSAALKLHYLVFHYLGITEKSEYTTFTYHLIGLIW